MKPVFLALLLIFGSGAIALDDEQPVPLNNVPGHEAVENKQGEKVGSATSALCFHRHVSVG
jgi:hypothetical protein